MSSNTSKDNSRPMGDSSGRTGGERRRVLKSRRLNVPLLAGSFAAILVLSLAAFFWNRHQTAKMNSALKGRAEVLKAKDDWAQAADYWQRYLWLEPDDFPARMELVKAREQLAKTPQQRYYLSGLLHDTLGRVAKGDDATKLDLDVRIAKNFLEMGSYASAYEKAYELLQLKERDPKPPAGQAGADLRRVLAMAGAAISRPGVKVDEVAARGDPGQRMLDPQYTADDLAVALAESPGDVKLAEVGAGFYRMCADSLRGGPEAANMRADRFIEKLVESQPDNADARVTRFVYRSRYPSIGGQPSTDDLDAALKIDPDHYNALVLKANMVAASNPAAGREMLARAIKLEPSDARAYLVLAQMEIGLNEAEAALSTLRDAQAAVGSDNPAIGEMYTRMLIRTGDLKGAAVALEKLEAGALAPDVPLSMAARRGLQDRMRLLRAQLEVASGDLNQAVESLQAVVAPAGESQETSVTREMLEAKRILAQLMERLGYWDLAAVHWHAVSALPQPPDETASEGYKTAYRTAAGSAADAMWRAAAAMLAAAQFDGTIQEIDRYLHPPDMPGGGPAWEPRPDAWLMLTQAHLRKQIALRPEARNWSEFDAALASARKLNPNRWELLGAEFERQFAGEPNGAVDRAQQVLAVGETMYQDKADFWRLAALSYQRLGLATESDRALARFNELESDVSRQSVLKAVVTSRRGDFAAAQQAIKAAIDSAEPQAKLTLECMEIELLVAAGDHARAFSAAQSLVARNPKEPRALQVALEAALRVNEQNIAVDWENMLRAANPSDTFTPSLYEARRQVTNFDRLNPGERSNLAQLVQSLRDKRPEWGDVIALSARMADLQGNRAQAIDDYQLAVARGAENFAIAERLVTLLYAEGRTAEADEYFARLASSKAATPGMDSLKIVNAVLHEDLDQAIKVAEESMDEHPDDPVRRIWLARLHVENKDNDAAEEILRAASTAFPGDARVWSALFLLLQRSDQVDAARTLLDQFVAETPVGSWERHLIAAQAYQVLNDQTQALKQAEAAVQANGASVPSRMILAKLLMAVDVDRAADELEKILEIEKGHGEARRLSALLQAMSGDESEVRAALNKLQTEDTGGLTADGSADNRMRAALLSSQGRNRTQRLENLSAARQIMLEQIESRGAATSDLDRLFLAKLYEQEASLRGDVTLLQAAREQFQELTTRDAAPSANLREYADFLLRHLDKVEVPAAQQQDWSSLRSNFLDDAQRLASDCGRRLESHTIDPERQASILEAFHLASSQGRLLSGTGDAGGGAEAIATFEAKMLPGIEAALGKPRAWVSLAGLYAAVDDHARAEQWYRKLVDVAPETYPLLVRELVSQDRVADAAEICLAEAVKSGTESADAAIVLTQVLAGAPDQEAIISRSEPIIAAAMKAHPENLDLLLAVAVLRVARNDDAEAIRMFEQVVKLAPKNALALNNLATLLAEQPDRRNAALGFVNRAIDENGRQPPFLDTLGTIQIRAGQAVQAIANLEEAVANGGADPRYYFHLAAALQLGKQPDEARAALREALQRGLDEQILTQGDQQLLKELKQQLAPASAPRLESQATEPDDSVQSAVTMPHRRVA